MLQVRGVGRTTNEYVIEKYHHEFPQKMVEGDHSWWPERLMEHYKARKALP